MTEGIVSNEMFLLQLNDTVKNNRYKMFLLKLGDI